MAYGGYQQPPPPPPAGGTPPPPPPSGGAPPPGQPYGQPYGQPQYEDIPGWWWIIVILFTWIGGLIVYLVWKDKNPEKAKKMLIVGIVLTIVYAALPFIIGGAMCLMM